LEHDQWHAQRLLYVRRMLGYAYCHGEIETGARPQALRKAEQQRANLKPVEHGVHTGVVLTPRLEDDVVVVREVERGPLVDTEPHAVGNAHRIARIDQSILGYVALD